MRVRQSNLLRLLSRLGLLRDDLLHLRLSALHPKRNRHNSKVGRHQHGAGQVRADADEALLLHEQIKKEALVQVFQQVVETPKSALDDPSDGHLVLPPVAERLQRHRVHMVWDETAVRAARQPQPLLQHTAQHGL